MRSYILAIIASILLLGTAQLDAQQCRIRNNVFQAGEEIKLDLYFKYGLLYTKAGNSTLKVENAFFAGKPAYKLTLIAASTGAVEKFFSLNDTIISYITKDVVPLAIYKNAHEGGDITIEETTYSYSGNQTTIKAKRVKNERQRYDETITTTNCIYDYLSVVFYARTLDYDNMKKGDKVPIEFMSGKNKVNMEIVHEGTEKMKANNGKKYDCIKLSLKIGDDAFDDEKEAMKVYITNDNNRMVIRMDSKLKVGSTRALLKSYSGNRHAID
ncbi:DUF3108 domain-containing protein [Dysgonomonas sp. 25]|uniref:DUF3108 domain-containing protein n=1 Tax=Dysgonomonas sp. 25 TaxID=2302933 RepID=UPI0013D447FA|nr:DUF3108 domain-containing protein [Dysgonomonas sp. 25]NDV69489.1 DUF3108 domain-containing protein [Dysgonomonas sp. 25]